MNKIPYKETHADLPQGQEDKCLGGCSCPSHPSKVAWPQGLPRLAQGPAQQLVLSPLTSGGHTLLSFLSLLGLLFGPGGKGWVLGPHLFQGLLRGLWCIRPSLAQSALPFHRLLHCPAPLPALPKRAHFQMEKLDWRRGDIHADGGRGPPPPPLTHICPLLSKLILLLSHVLTPRLSAKDPTSKTLAGLLCVSQLKVSFLCIWPQGTS